MENSWQVRLGALIQREVLRFMRVLNQTFIPPLLSALLYFLVFGVFIGERVGQVEGISYLLFLVPGLILMNAINSAYHNSVATLFIAKWTKHIYEVLVSPVSYWELTGAYLVGGLVRVFILSIATYLLAGLFTTYQIAHPLEMIYLLTMSSIFFIGLGLGVALWANDWEQLEFLPSFILTPLSFLGGVFYSVKMLPGTMQTITYFNPLFYYFDAFRWAMLDYSEGNLIFAFMLISGLALFSFLWVTYLFKSGYKLRP